MFFILLNFIILLTILYFIFSDEIEITMSNKLDKLFIQPTIKFVGVIIITFFALYMFFSSLETIYTTPYEDKRFWNTEIKKNGLSSVNMALLFNSLKLTQLYDNNISIRTNGNEKMISRIIEKRELNVSICLTSKSDFFYIPYKEKKLFFINPKNNTTKIYILNISNDNMMW